MIGAVSLALVYESAWYSCNRCESVLSSAWNVCPMCGTDHRTMPDPPRCPQCAMHVTQQWGWCPECGHQLVSDRT